MSEPSVSEQLIYDWNAEGRSGPLFPKKPEFDDETLRDGIQSPSVADPSIEDKLEILHLQDKLGITTSNIGLPGAGPRAKADVERLVTEIRDQKLSIVPNCAAARSSAGHPAGRRAVSQKTGVPIEVYTFIGSSPIRQFAENWDIDHIQRTMEKAIEYAVKEGMHVAYVTEDTTRSRPDHLDRLFRHAINLGSRRLVICDTVGHATPDGIFNLIGWVGAWCRAWAWT
jgi:2-isopropylmalate synthase